MNLIKKDERPSVHEGVSGPEMVIDMNWNAELVRVHLKRDTKTHMLLQSVLGRYIFEAPNSCESGSATGACRYLPTEADVIAMRDADLPSSASADAVSARALLNRSGKNNFAYQLIEPATTSSDGSLSDPAKREKLLQLLEKQCGF